MKKLLSLCLAVFIGLVGLKTFIHSQIRAQLEELKNTLKPFADLEYKSITTSLLHQSASIKGIEINPIHSAAPIYIDSITMSGNHWDSGKANFDMLLQFDKPIKQKFEVKNLKINIDEQVTYGSPDIQKKSSDFKTLSRLGYSTIAIDLDFELQTIPSLKQISIKLKQINQDMFKIAFDTEFRVKPSQQIDSKAHSLQDLQVVSGTFRFEDLSFLKRLFHFQAKSQHQALEKAKNKTLQNMLSTIQQKFVVLDDNQTQIIHEVFYQSKPLTIEIRPMEPMGLAAFRALNLYSPEDIHKILNLKMSNE